MGFKKEVYDVDEKGLDPTEPHNDIGSDGKLVIETALLDTPAVEEPKKVPRALKKVVRKKTASARKKESVTLKNKETKETKNSDELLSAITELPTKTGGNKANPKKTTNNTKKRTPGAKTTRRKVVTKEES